VTQFPARRRNAVPASAHGRGAQLRLSYSGTVERIFARAGCKYRDQEEAIIVCSATLPAHSLDIASVLLPGARRISSDPKYKRSSVRSFGSCPTSGDSAEASGGSSNRKPNTSGSARFKFSRCRETGGRHIRNAAGGSIR